MKHWTYGTAAAAVILLVGGGQRAQAQEETYLASIWNGKKVYLSPARHNLAPGAQGECQGNKEDDMAYWTSWDAAHGEYYSDVYQPTHNGRNLLTRGYDVKIGTGTYQSAVNLSNDWAAHIHIPIHSNADVHNQCTRTNADNFGTVVMHRNTSTMGANLGQLLLDNVGISSPGTPPRERMCPNPPAAPCTGIEELYELKYTTAVAAYLEQEFHTWDRGIEWIARSYQWAWRIGVAIDQHLGYPQPRQ